MLLQDQRAGSESEHDGGPGAQRCSVMKLGVCCMLLRMSSPDSFRFDPLYKHKFVSTAEAHMPSWFTLKEQAGLGHAGEGGTAAR